MKRLILTATSIALLSGVAMASSPLSAELSTAKVDKPTMEIQNCDFIERLMGLCRSSQKLPSENE
ncbi:MAG: hypothetical protein K0U38_06895 [Epsilonproteobacteria bacterium]|nr:hypothetical protein [Campylobacterota bacterium]